MSGIWERVAKRGERDDPVGSLTLSAAIYFASRDMFTPRQVRNKLERTITTPLSDEDEADLIAIIAQAKTGTAAQRVDYLLRVQTVLIAAETGMINSAAVFRTELGIAQPENPV